MATESSVMAVIRASRPSFRNDHDRVAFALHAAFLAAGFSLTATGPAAASAADNPPPGEDEVGIDGWNTLEDTYSFVYTKNENGVKRKVWLKCLAIGDALMVDALNVESNKEPHHLEINVKEFCTETSNQTQNFGEMYKSLNVLVDHVNAGLLTKIEPKAESSSSSSRSGHDFSETVVGIPVEPQPSNPGFIYPPIPSSGNNDLFPLPGAGFYPQRGPDGGGIGGGMLVGPNDPLFLGAGRQPGSFGPLGPLPPGSRYDPIGPPDVPGFEPGRFLRLPRRPPGGGGSTHPDLEQFPGSDII